jgi:hypothetical protein
VLLYFIQQIELGGLQARTYSTEHLAVKLESRRDFDSFCGGNQSSCDKKVSTPFSNYLPDTDQVTWLPGKKHSNELQSVKQKAPWDAECCRTT